MLKPMNYNRKKPSRIEQLSDVAAYVLPYLLPAELSAVALTCKTLHLFVKSVTAVRSSDACRNYEKLPVPFVNSTVDNHRYAYFIYSPTQVLSLPDDPRRQPWGLCFDGRPDLNLVLPPTVEDGGKCECERCDGDTVACPCSRLKLPGLKWECGSCCTCGLECGNRVCQRGLSVRLKVVRSRRKGWGLHADQFIRGGDFICEYAGELLTTKEARRRQLIYDKLASTGKHTSALLVVREHLPSGNACMRINIDATRIGNVARFINHSCDGGNLLTVLVRSSGALLPRVCFLASRDISIDEELTFSYGDTGLNPNGSQCFCGSSCCSGIMPSEHT
ncbi:histone-lysine N-methyltransferase SUVR3 [Cynara cardunculus var. scolymus]|uniref:Post-SET domain-containing protein n=1 Tax=Cynara cardunculus var. scolymus TaxID=59895 RepID=A0A103Y011_CYNCS|nr:histone-lysine N-methyltransferase SUVR3 [Cynara cardunculus var. scolymus]XP_024984470.1 histone-lysine N-methyltransferase SUVR3 [Cynara cardunculus var. scolymus]XP_024984471.1 histone-lysine N-methyltransferase SUVR3 [Cynara cardunculus var. scolymus]KVI00025.1 Post-SET domain-containing protein [Cynara cardunculus var. scolymus]